MSILPASFRSRLRLAAALGGMALLAACSAPQHMSSSQEAARYAARARHNYVPPGPPSDPWGPYIVEAAARYDVPERWVREVIRAESSGKVYETSAPGAMGLMQVMPGTYDELRSRYSLGDDPYDPRDNILAGTAYVRELYDIYGTPGFLAAYNAGPGRLDDYLTRNRPLPDETRHYVAKIGPYIRDSFPQRLSPSTALAMNQMPIDIPSGPRYPRSRYGQPVALAENRGAARGRATGWQRDEVQVAALPEPPRMSPPPSVLAPRVEYAAARAPVPASHGFRLIPQAMAAEPVPLHRGAAGGPANGAWAIQVGAFGNEAMARSAADAARGHAGAPLAVARTQVGTVRQGGGTLYRARLVGLSRDAALQACEHIAHGRGACVVISPETQS